MEVGRNDLCYCGSNKKYKKCCINKTGTTNQFKFNNQNPVDLLNVFANNYAKSERNDLEPFFADFDSTELLKIFALLQVLPENHGKNIRLEIIQKQIILSNTESKDPVDLKRVKEFVKKKYPYNYQEDPSENLFTQNIMTPKGNMIIFSGLSENQIFILQHFLTVLSNKNPQLNDSFRMEALQSCMFLLKISDQIANHFGYERNLFAEQTKTNDIYFPKNESIHFDKNVLSYTEKDLQEIATDLGCPINIIDEYLIDLKNEGFESNDDNLNPIIYSPVLKKDEEYIILSPTNIAFSIVNNVLKKAIQYKCIEKFLELFSEVCWFNCRFYLENMGYKQINFVFPNNSNIPVFEGLFLFDQKKIAYVRLVYDIGEAYNPLSPLTSFVDLDADGKIQKRNVKILKLLLKDERFKDHDFFEISILNGIGRPTTFLIPEMVLTVSKPVYTQNISFSMVDLSILFKSGKCKNLTLWNYVKASKKNNLITPFFLDNISFFIAHDESFYISDDAVDGLLISVGEALPFKAEAIRKFDEHSALYHEHASESSYPISREIFPAQLSIYSTKAYSPFIPFMVFTPCLRTNIWIKPHKERCKLTTDSEIFDSEVCIAIAYWFNEVSRELIKLADFENLLEIYIEIETTGFNISSETICDNFEDEIIIESQNNKIIIKLNEHFYSFLYREDNLAERVLIKKILEKFNKLFIEKGLSSAITSESIDCLIDIYMPLGMKKKLLLLFPDNKNIRMDSSNILSLRNLSKFDVNRQIDDLGKLLSPKPYKERKITVKSEKIDLVNSVVTHFYENLRKISNDFDNNNVLSMLISMYESSIQSRERFELEVNPMIECYKNHIDIDTFISQKNKKRVELSTSLRCLIEHFVAEPTSGIKKLTMEVYDSMVAYMVNIINWGFISDSLQFNVDDINISLLPSGRIGTGKSFEEKVIHPYYNQKFKEDICDFKNNFTNKFILSKNNFDLEISQSDEQFDIAFESEFEISFDDFSKIINLSVYLGYQKEEKCGFYNDTKSNYIHEVSVKLGLSKDTVEEFLNKFSLFNRGSLDNVMELGFKNQDHYPWRFNRELSLLRRPFLIITDNDTDYVWFGFRSLEDFKSYFFDKIYSGRFNGKSPDMKSFLRSLNNKNGEDFNNEVFNFLKLELKDVEVFKEIPIKPKAKLSNIEDLGDLDILLIDKTNCKIVAIECKAINASKTPYEMSSEFKKFIGGSKPWIPKVDKRNSWVINNVGQMSKLTKCLDDFKEFDFEYIFLTNEAIPLPLIQENNISYRFVTFYDVKQNLEILFRDRK